MLFTLAIPHLITNCSLDLILPFNKISYGHHVVCTIKALLALLRGVASLKFKVRTCGTD